MAKQAAKYTLPGGKGTLSARSAGQRLRGYTFAVVFGDGKSAVQHAHGDHCVNPLGNVEQGHELPHPIGWDYQEFRVWPERLNLFMPLPG